jgi:hydrogenase maturation protein HypF
MTPAAAGSRAGHEARRITVGGRVQGVGFRPFVYRLATSLGIHGWVRNEAGTVHIHAEGPAAALDRFEQGLVSEAPPLARPEAPRAERTAVAGHPAFEIVESQSADEADNHLPPDLFVCDDCLAELHDPTARRHDYPFINCTQCGPRYTIIRALPYDRPATTMAGFPLCPDCRREYEDPGDRRFHAEPLACPVCGPHCTFVTGKTRIDGSEAAITAALAALRAGQVLAVKGVGGYHLMADAMSDAAVRRLRERKHRPHKPLAVMFPLGSGSEPLAPLRTMLAPDAAQAAALVDPARPIVLTRKRADCPLPDSIAPGLAEIGAFLPYSPLHHLLLAGFRGPLVATSGNISGEPVLTDEAEAGTRLAGIADGFLHHDRPIERPADDSVLRVSAGIARPIRVGRGLAPLELDLSFELPEPVLAVGGHMKSTVALAFGRRAVVSPHIGELNSPRSLAVFGRVIADLQALYGKPARRLLCDAHPNYASTLWAKAAGLPVTSIFHHHAHAATLAHERPEVTRWLVLAWDGVGYGEDGTLWGGECFLGRPGDWQRVGSFIPFRPVGGERAAREPWRSAASLCWQAGREVPFQREGLDVARQAWEKGLNTPQTSACGRLFDAAACLVLGFEQASFEGQGPMLLEAIADDEGEALHLPLVDDGGVRRIDWAPLVAHLSDPALPACRRAADFHATLAAAALELAQAIRAGHDYEAVGVSGGVFQNRRLTELLRRRFDEAGLTLHVPRVIPVNDAGIAFGQIMEFGGMRRLGKVDG